MGKSQWGQVACPLFPAWAGTLRAFPARAGGLSADSQLGQVALHRFPSLGRWLARCQLGQVALPFSQSGQVALQRFPGWAGTLLNIPGRAGGLQPIPVWAGGLEPKEGRSASSRGLFLTADRLREDEGHSSPLTADLCGALVTWCNRRASRGETEIIDSRARIYKCGQRNHHFY